MRALTACTLRLQQILATEDNEMSRTLNDAVATLEELAERMSNCDLEDYDLVATVLFYSLFLF